MKPNKQKPIYTKAQRKAYHASKVQKEEEEMELNKKRLADEAPGRGTNPLAEDPKVSLRTAKEYWPLAVEFKELPISTKTIKGLHIRNYKTMTDVQRATIPHSLVGRDVLGAAKTGSGKTLAFVIPILEKLHMAGWSKMDGLGALVLCSTRELATQTFHTLRLVGQFHGFSAALIIGGDKHVTEETRKISRMNIIVATPGRLLMHMDKTPDFRTDNLQILVLDEADQILANGYEREVNAIIENLPKERQTLLFSATQTKKVSDLVRLSLHNPEFLSVHEESITATPERLVQSYFVIGSGEKLNVLWSFIKAHLRSKILVFVQTTKQARFIHETFRLMRPGIPFYHLTGKMSQNSRMGIYQTFARAKHACLISTDVASRGLDFKDIQWVVQMDCPFDVETYIHRAGRTARYTSGGRCTLFLLPSERAFVQKLHDRKIPISKSNMNKARALEIDVALQSLIIQKPELKLLAQKAVKSYVRGVYLASDKSVFDITKVDLIALSNSMGLLQVPNIKFAEIKKIDKHEEMLKTQMKQLENETDSEETSDNEETLRRITKLKEKKKKSKLERLMGKKNTILQQTEGKTAFDYDSEDDNSSQASDNDSIESSIDKSEDDILAPVPKSKQKELEDTVFTPNVIAEMEAAEKLRQEKKKNRIKINVHAPAEDALILGSESDSDDDDDNDEDSNSEDEEENSSIPYAQRVAAAIKATDSQDREAVTERLRERRRKRKQELNEYLRGQQGEDNEDDDEDQDSTHSDDENNSEYDSYSQENDDGSNYDSDMEQFSDFHDDNNDFDNSSSSPISDSELDEENSFSDDEEEKMNTSPQSKNRTQKTIKSNSKKRLPESDDESDQYSQPSKPISKNGKKPFSFKPPLKKRKYHN